MNVRLSSKGQIVIPKHIREGRSWEPGQEFHVVQTERGVLLEEKRAFPVKTVDEAFGCGQHDGEPVPTEKMTGAEAFRIKRQRAEVQQPEDTDARP